MIKQKNNKFYGRAATKKDQAKPRKSGPKNLDGGLKLGGSDDNETKFTDIMTKGQIELQVQKKFEIESRWLEFDIKFASDQINDLRQDYKMCESDEELLKK